MFIAHINTRYGQYYTIKATYIDTIKFRLIRTGFNDNNFSFIFFEPHGTVPYRAVMKR